MIQIIENIDIQPILQAYHSLSDDIRWTDYAHKGKQAGLQYRSDENVWKSAVGKCTAPEHTYSQLNPAITGTIFEEIITTYSLLRTRLMWVGPFACYSMHCDTTARIHIPLITYPDCYFLFKNAAPIHMPTGNVYWTDTTQPHTFLNCTDKPRLHLIGVTSKLS